MAKLKETRQRCGSYTDPQTSRAEPRAQKPDSHMFMVRWLPEEPNPFDGERTDSSLLWTTSNLSGRSYISCIRAKPDSSQHSKKLVFATDGKMVKMHRTRGHEGTIPNWYINSTTPVPKAWRTSWKKEYKDCKSQRARKSTVIVCLLEMTGSFTHGTSTTRLLIQDLKRDTNRHVHMEEGNFIVPNP